MKFIECELCSKPLHTGKKALLGACLNPECTLLRLQMKKNLKRVKLQSKIQREDERNQLDIIKEKESPITACIVCSKTLSKMQVKNKNKTCSTKCAGRRASHLKRIRQEMFAKTGVIPSKMFLDSVRTFLVRK